MVIAASWVWHQNNSSMRDKNYFDDANCSSNHILLFVALECDFESLIGMKDQNVDVCDNRSKTRSKLAVQVSPN